MTKKAVIFVHIPKTGGLTMRRILDRQYRGKGILRISPEEPRKQLKSMSPDDVSNIKAIYGHCSFGIHRSLEKPAVYITMLREPLSRIVSAYFFIRSRPQNRLYNKVRNMSFKQFVTSSDPEIRLKLFNHQTRVICGQEKPDLALAKHRIKTYFPVVGITEMYPESIYMMHKRLGWKLRPYTRENVTKKPKGELRISRRLQKWIRENNALDYALYEYAKERLQSRIERLKPKHKYELSSFVRKH